MILSVPAKVIFLAILGTFVCVLLNEVNAHFLNANIPNQFGLIHTADEASYIAPARNFVDKGVWRDNSNGLTAYYQRPPGYGWMYSVYYFLFNKYAFLGMKIMQISGFFLSILIFWKILILLKLPNQWAFFTTATFALLPCYSGFVYFSITEGVTPFLVLWSILEILKADRKEMAPGGLIISNALLLLVRPQLAIFPLMAIIYFIFRKNRKISLYLLSAFIPIVCWYARTAYISGESPSLHPIYSATNNHLFRPTHAAMTEIYRVWEYRSDVFHSQIGRIAYGDSTQIDVVNAEIPIDYQEGMHPIFERYQALNKYQAEHFKNELSIHSFAGELKFIKDVKELRADFIAKHPAEYYIKTPLKSAKEFFNKSYLNLYIFQSEFRGNVLVELLRIGCWFVILASAFFVILSPIQFSWKSIEFFISASIFIFMFYLVFVQRLNEERYLIPILPLMLILGAQCCYNFTRKIKYVFVSLNSK